MSLPYIRSEFQFPGLVRHFVVVAWSINISDVADRLPLPDDKEEASPVHNIATEI
jgi:hypothetical protein